MTTTDDRLVFPAHAWPLFKDSLQHIADHPDEFYMGSWVSTAHTLADEGITVEDIEKVTGHPFPACGTVACLAGRITITANPGVLDHEWPDVDTYSALTALGITDPDGDVVLTDRVAYALEGVFDMTHIRTYAELRGELESRFVFPEPLPVPAGVAE